MDSLPSDPQEPRSDSVLPLLAGDDYAILAARAQQTNDNMWEVPALGLTAQAFLFTIALGEGPAVSRLVAASLSAVTAALSVQLMAKQRYVQLLDAIWLEDHECRTTERSSITLHGAARDRGKLIEQSARWPGGGRLAVTQSSWLIRVSSFQLWIYGLATFGVVALGAAVASAIEIARTLL